VVFFGSHAGEQSVKGNQWVGSIATIQASQEIEGVLIASGHDSSARQPPHRVHGLGMACA
jgi:hypothetical protein